MKAMMAGWWDGQDVPANCEVQVEVRFGILVKLILLMRMKVNARSCQLP